MPPAIDVRSPITWFFIVVAAIVLALTLSTRRETRRSRLPAATLPAAGRWAEAQALFLAAPRAGAERAEAIVRDAIGERFEAQGALPSVAASYAAGLAVVQRSDASTEELRLAFADFQSAFEAMKAGPRS